MKKSVDFYLSKGFDRKTAEYFAEGRKKVVSAEPNENFTITLSFDNGEVRLYDMKPLLKAGTVFEKIAEYKNFKRVYIDEQQCVSWDIDPNVDSNKVWNNKLDISPESCYLDSVPI